MFKRAYRHVLVVAATLSIAGLAAAHQPPSLEKRQAAAAHAVQSSGGYRDMRVRFGDVTRLTPSVMKSAGGYRDILHRFPGTSPRHVEAASLSGRSRVR